jgi:translation initiation factor 1
MAREPRKRIELGPPAGGLNAAFAGLSADALGPLPEGPGEAPQPPEAAGPPTKGKGRLVLRREKAGRGGKTVVVVSGFDPGMGEGAIADLAAELRARCGCGGTCRDREIEIQGDHPGRVRALLAEVGFRVVGP